MPLTGLDFLFWVSGLAGHIALLGVLWLRHRAARFPIFTVLITVDVIRTVVLFAAFHHASTNTYFLAYWSLAIVDVVLQLSVVYEMASQVFRPLGVWARDVRRSSIWLLLGSFVIAAALTLLAAPAAFDWRQRLVIEGNLFSSALMSELFVAMIALAVTVGLPWRTHVARISQGLGVYATVGILVTAGHSYFGATHQIRIDRNISHIRMAIYLVCVAYWIVTLWPNEPEAKILPADMRRHLSILQGRVAYDLSTIRSWRKQ